MRVPRTELLVVVALVGLVALAGCAGLLGGGPGSDGGDTPSPTTETEPEVDGAELRSAALSAIDETEAYRVAATQEVVVRGPRTRRSTVTDRSRIDRANRELRRNRTVVARGQRVNYTQYVVDRTFYARSDVYVRQYSSKWIKSDLRGNFSTIWEQQDTLGQLRTVLSNASSVEVTAVETVGGRETYRTRVNISESAFESVLFDVLGLDPGQAQGVNVTNVEYVYWLDRETARPVKTVAQVNFTATVTGQTVRQSVATTARYSYEPVSVSLPDAAEDAVNLSSRRLTPRPSSDRRVVASPPRP